MEPIEGQIWAQTLPFDYFPGSHCSPADHLLAKFGVYFRRETWKLVQPSQGNTLSS
ncbi:hypothetical protein EMIT0P258_60189 [Pseudomonas sp. IT-P258]